MNNLGLSVIQRALQKSHPEIDQLLKACRTNQPVALIEEHLQSWARHPHEEEIKNWCFQLCVLFGHVEAAAHLLDRCIHPDPAMIHELALYCALRGQDQMVMDLLDTHPQSINHTTILHAFCMKGNINMVEKMWPLLPDRFEGKSLALVGACSSNNDKLIQWMLDQGAHPDPQYNGSHVASLAMLPSSPVVDRVLNMCNLEQAAANMRKLIKLSAKPPFSLHAQQNIERLCAQRQAQKLHQSLSHPSGPSRSRRI